MKVRPILFSAPMVRALLDGTKTQTRRVVKPQPELHARITALKNVRGGFVDRGERQFACPYGQPGDRLWVRETWLEDPEDDGSWHYTQHMGCKGSPLSDIPARFQKPEHCIFRADWNGSDLVWRPSIHMPRWASRILLEIVSVRVERLQAISADDCHAEGIGQCDGLGSNAEILDLARRMGDPFGEPVLRGRFQNREIVGEGGASFARRIDGDIKSAIGGGANGALCHHNSFVEKASLA